MPPATSRPRRTPWPVIGVAVAAVLILGGLGWLVVRPAIQSYITPTSWIESDASGVLYVSWQPSGDGGAITGTWKGASYESSAGAVQTTTMPFTGSIGGNTVYFTFTLQGTTTVTLKGILGFRTLTIGTSGD